MAKIRAKRLIISPVYGNIESGIEKTIPDWLADQFEEHGLCEIISRDTKKPAAKKKPATKKKPKVDNKKANDAKKPKKETPSVEKKLIGSNKHKMVYVSLDGHEYSLQEIIKTIVTDEELSVDEWNDLQSGERSERIDKLINVKALKPKQEKKQGTRRRPQVNETK